MGTKSKETLDDPLEFVFFPVTKAFAGIGLKYATIRISAAPTTLTELIFKNLQFAPVKNFSMTFP
jgi:hypothetical protein